MFCRGCGKEVNENDEFCGNCGAAVRSTRPQVPGGAPPASGAPTPYTIYTGPAAPPPAAPPPPPPPPPAGVPLAGAPVPFAPVAPVAPAGKGGFFSSSAGKALIVVVALLVAAGVALGIFLIVRSGDEGKAREKADKVTAQASDDLSAAGKDLEDMQESAKAIDFKSIDQATPIVDEDQSDLEKISESIEDSRDELEGLDTGKLTQQQRDSIEALLAAVDEYAKACKELGDLLTRSLAIGEFEGCIDAAVGQFNGMVEYINQGVAQHNADQYPEALSSAQTAQGMLNQARAYLTRAKELEPGADLSYHFGNLDNAQRFLNTFIQICETIIAGDYDTHNALVDQSWGEDNSVSGDMSFDYDSFFGEEQEKASATIEKHLKEASGYLDDAEP